MDKVEQIVAQLQQKGWKMELKDYDPGKVWLILEQYDIHESMTVEEYLRLVWRLFRICFEEEVKKMK